MKGFTGHDLACWRGARLLFENLGFQVEPGAVLIVRGPNGSGKTSLLRMMAGLVRPASGKLEWNGQDITYEPASFHRDMVLVGHREAVKATLTVRENLDFIARLRAQPLSQDRLLKALDTFGLATFADLPAGLLSAGQWRRLALSRLVAVPARLWLLDEPLTNLDSAATDGFLTLLKQHCAGGGMAVVSSNVEMDLPDALDLELEGQAVGVEQL